MKKVININLGGLPHIIDEDAYATLDRYLSSLQRHFRGSTGYENIIQDIEVRLSELLSENRGSRKIIEMKDIQHAISVMGKPEQMGGAEENESEDAFSGTHASDDVLHHTSYKGSRRFYRNSDNKVVAGVASGLSAYFGIDNPLWIRLLFGLSAFTGGIGLLVYIILWIAVPVAKTSAEKLAMYGEAVNINSIANKIQDDLSELGKRITDLGHEFRNR